MLTFSITKFFVEIRKGWLVLSKQFSFSTKFYNKLESSVFSSHLFLV